jgi:predicted metal-dependent enzyme (double-stranded beta helix superfamily)
MSFTFETFVEDVRKAAASSMPNEEIRLVLERYVADPEPIIAATEVDGEDEIMLYQDEQGSIWRCRFQPHVTMPPHEHRLKVHIAAYSGGEKNILFKRDGGQLQHERTHIVKAGEVFTLEDNGIHAVVGDGDEPSLALHVYMGPLTTLKRDLFDWASGEPLEFSMENFDRMKRHSSELPEY